MNGRPHPVVVGVGNALAGDDGVGLAVAARLRARLPDTVAVVDCEREPTRLLETWSGATVALLVDAVDSGAAPGTLHRFDASERPLPVRVFRSSTHAFGVGETIELARALGTLPGSVVVHGIEGQRFTAGEGLSDAVDAAVEGAVRAVIADLDQFTKEEGTDARTSVDA